MAPVINELKRTYGRLEIDLDQIEGRTFVEAWLDTHPNLLGPAFRATLNRHTQGQPLFTVELVQAMKARGDLVRDEAGRWMEGPTLLWGHVPARVEAVIAERVDRLSPDLRTMLAVASVEGEIFTAQVVARVLDLRERPLLQQLAWELERRHRMVRIGTEVQVGQRLLTRFRFSHTLFQQYLYNQLGLGERRLLHGEVAAALVELYSGQTDEITVQLAHHYTEAGERTLAVEYLFQAGDRARGRYGHRVATEAYERALMLLKELGDHDRAARTLMKLGLSHHLAFDFPQARRAYQESFDLWQRAGVTRSTGTWPPAPHPLRIDWLDPPTLDPTMAGTTTATKVVDQLFRGLVALSPDLDIIPELAHSWEVLDDGRRYVFHLQEDANWSDGSPVTAADFVYAWRRTLDPATGSFNANLLHDVKGGRAFHQGRLHDSDQVGVHAPNNATLVVDLEEPTSYFLHILTHCASFPVPRHVVEAHGPVWTEVAHIVTNGPFKLVSWEEGESLLLARNPAYTGRVTGNVQQVALSLALPPADSTKLALYDQDALDIVSDLPPRQWDLARRRYAGEYVVTPWLMTRYVGFDMSRPPFDDVRVRRALVLATDRETLADVLWGGTFVPATGGFVAPGMPGHSAGIGLPYDPQLACRLLAEAGYAGGHGFPVLRALGPPGHEMEFLSEALQKQWRETLGIEVA